MKKFLVLYLTPIKVLDDWANTDEGERKKMEDTMKTDMRQWIHNNEKSIVDIPAGTGKTTMVNKDGVTDTRNDVMMYSVMQAPSQHDVAMMFKNHPHLQIPQATIEIMEINQMK